MTVILYQVSYISRPYMPLIVNMLKTTVFQSIAMSSEGIPSMAILPPWHMLVSITNVESVETPDDYTVVVTMSDINAASLETWASTVIVQSAYHAEVGEDIYRTAPIGTGAYSSRSGGPPNSPNWKPLRTTSAATPNIDVIRLDVVPEPSVRTIALQTGDADATVWPLLVEDTMALAEDPDFVVLDALGNSIKHFPLNNSLPQLSDKRVRQAMPRAGSVRRSLRTSGQARPMWPTPTFRRPASTTMKHSNSTLTTSIRPTRC